MCFSAQVLKETPQKWLWLQKHQSGKSVASVRACVRGYHRRGGFKWSVAVHVGGGLGRWSRVTM